MAVVNTPLSSSLRLEVQTGTDTDGKPIYRVRSFNHVKPSATDQDVFDVAQSLSSLQVHPLNAVSRVNENDLSNQATA
ncbi:MAG: hypothetical protein PWP31_1726 [Clostridia bacterium]|nr:hypothetical protein [Clostridia bacterium]